MSRSCLFTWRLSICIFNRLSSERALYRKLSNPQLYSICNYASFTKILQTLEPQAETSSSSDSSDSDSENEKNSNLMNVKLQILNAALDFVPEHGWSKQSIAFGAQSLGLSSSSHTLIQDGGAELVHYFNFLCNEKLEIYLKRHYCSKKIDIETYMEDALTSRLKMVIPYVSKWPEAMALMVTPLQLSTDFKNLLDLVDMIWYQSGDKSLDLTWYNTFEFLQRRVKNVIHVSELGNNIASSSEQLPNVATGALITARNILGINRWFR
ncbi:ubiquinone biosynthesis protein COQ9, mitochondrial [Caerostris darwini]|uniref:Ubiquinone biosynthesis protein n=1 Tax=Caerostris darwini TaxID=1538125 RepID=A0AAV4MEQ2_9ARAC|nr:ubiquinone biosynthesis protein COQ9, mitochondrial [Caerostris darwini]